MPHAFASEPPGDMAPSAGESDTAAPRGISVIIAESRASYRICLTQLFKATPDLHVAAALADGAVVLREAIRRRPRVVIAAMDLPGMSGVEIARCLRALLPEIATILLLEEADDRQIRLARDARALPLVLPDADVLEVVGIVRALGRGRVNSQTTAPEIEAAR